MMNLYGNHSNIINCQHWRWNKIPNLSFRIFFVNVWLDHHCRRHKLIFFIRAITIGHRAEVSLFRVFEIASREPLYPFITSTSWWEFHKKNLYAQFFLFFGKKRARMRNLRYYIMPIVSKLSTSCVCVTINFYVSLVGYQKPPISLYSNNIQQSAPHFIPFHYGMPAEIAHFSNIFNNTLHWHWK